MSIFKQEMDFTIEVPLRWEKQSSLAQPSSAMCSQIGNPGLAAIAFPPTDCEFQPLCI